MIQESLGLMVLLVPWEIKENRANQEYQVGKEGMENQVLQAPRE